MFKDIQTMGFTAAYLKVNSKSWAEAEDRERTRMQEEFDRAENQRLREEAREKDEETADKDQGDKLTTRVAMPADGAAKAPKGEKEITK
jgi:hypothetical protein